MLLAKTVYDQNALQLFLQNARNYYDEDSVQVQEDNSMLLSY